MPQTPVTDADITAGLLPLLGGDDPATAYALLRENTGVQRTELANGGHVWLVTRYADVRECLADPRLSLSKSNSRQGYQGFALPPALDANLLNLDSPDHTRLRRLVAGAFTARRVANLREPVRSTVDGLLDEIAQHGHADLIADFTAPLPISVICDLLGVPRADGAAFRTWTTALMTSSNAGMSPATAMAEMHAFLVDLITRKRAEPVDDLLSAMIQARDGADRLTEDELISLVFLILFAGYETSVHLMSAGIVSLLDNPTELATLRAQASADTPVVARMIEELVRRDAPIVTAIRRFPTEDIKVGGVTIPAGDTVLLCVNAANRDPDHFTTPDEFDSAREDNPHLGFGHGPHYCLGASLARLETSIALWTLLRRFPDLALAVPADQLRWHTTHRQRALRELPVTFAPVSPR